MRTRPLPSRAFASVAVLLATLIGITAVAAQPAPYPNRPIKLVVPFPPGGGADLTARTLAQKMGESMGQPIVIDNKPGANGSLGTDMVAKAAPDGYTILITDRGALGVNPSLYAKLPYDPLKDFSYIGIATDGPYVLVVHPSLNVKSVAELTAISKGEMVMPFIGAADRDPSQFPEPDRLDIGRTDNRHIAFGWGIHFCLGAPLARVEGQIAINTLVQRLPKLALATDRPEHRESLTLRGLKALPVSF